MKFAAEALVSFTIVGSAILLPQRICFGQCDPNYFVKFFHHSDSCSGCGDQEESHTFPFVIANGCDDGKGSGFTHFGLADARGGAASASTNWVYGDHACGDSAVLARSTLCDLVFHSSNSGQTQTSFSARFLVIVNGTATAGCHVDVTIGGPYAIYDGYGPHTGILTVMGTVPVNVPVTATIIVQVGAGGSLGNQSNSVNAVVTMLTATDSNFAFSLPRGVTADSPSMGIVDNILPPPCDADFDLNNFVNVDDLLNVVNHWGACTGGCNIHCAGDADLNCFVNTDDLLAVVNHWGPCP